MGCSCYCGLETRANRLKWAVFVIAAVAGVPFIAAGRSEARKCRDTYQVAADCQQENNVTQPGTSSDPCLDQESEFGACIVKHMGAIVTLHVLGILCFIICSIPLYMMCCCTQRPGAVAQYGKPALELRTGTSVSPISSQKPQKGTFTGHQHPSSMVGKAADDVLLDAS